MSIPRRVLPGLAIALLLAGLAVQPLAAASGGGSPKPADQKFVNGLWMLTFDTPEGQIRVNLPERLRQGELASGTLELFPRGEGDAFAANRIALAGYTLRLDGEELSAASGSFRWHLPAADINSRVELLDAAGRTVSSAPAILTPTTRRETPAPAQGLFDLPELVQRDHIFLIRGPFDGDLANTKVRIAGQPAEKIAESSELLVLRNVTRKLGRVSATVADGALRQRFVFNSIEVTLSAPKGAGRPGETMPVQVKIEGLQGMRQPFPVTLYNHRPEVATLPGGAEPLNRMVHPEEVDADGVFALNLDATVKSAGEMSVLAAVAAEVAIRHIENVTWPPHTDNVTYPPYHATNVTWPPHTTNVTFAPGHMANVTWPPHTANVTYPSFHITNQTWPPHTTNLSFVIIVEEDPAQTDTDTTGGTTP